jgi:hypothetical protein
MTQRQFLFIFIIRSKGRERKGGRMIAWEFDDRSRRKYQVKSRPNDHMFEAGLGCAGGLSARIVSRGHPESLT